MSSPYEGQITIDADLLHALWCYGTLQPVKGVIYSPHSHQECLAIVDRMFSDRAQPLSASAPTSWRHIETAPRDGTPFLCFHPDDVFSPQTGIDLIWYEPSIKTYTQDGDNEVPFAGITHWMPLPSPPQKGER